MKQGKGEEKYGVRCECGFKNYIDGLEGECESCGAPLVVVAVKLPPPKGKPRKQIKDPTFEKVAGAVKFTPKE